MTQLAKVSDTAGLAGFRSQTNNEELIKSEAGSLSTIAREEAELKGAIALAKHFPRDEPAAYTAIVQSCERPSLAESAVYSYPRGNTTVQGPSVNLAREIARCWGNIRFGLRIVTEDEERVHIKGYAFDLQTNAYVEMEDKFAKKIFRKGRGNQPGTWIKPDERDLRELINRRGAICVRNAILQVVPHDVTDDAVRKSIETMQKAAAGDLQQDRKSAVRRIVVAFAQIGVTAEMLRQWLGHELEAIAEDKLAELRTIYASIRDGNSTREEYFPLQRKDGDNGDAPPSDQSRTQSLANQLKPQTNEPEKKPEQQRPSRSTRQSQAKRHEPEKADDGEERKSLVEAINNAVDGKFKLPGWQAKAKERIFGTHEWDAACTVDQLRRGSSIAIALRDLVEDKGKPDNEDELLAMVDECVKQFKPKD